MFSTNNCLTVNVNIGQEGLLLMFCSSSSLSFFSLPLHSASGFMDGNYKNKIVFCEKNFLVGLCTLHSIYPDGGSLSGSLLQAFTWCKTGIKIGKVLIR